MLEGAETKIIREKNVVGVIKGKDKKLSEEYIILSAHYDHVGVGDPVKKEACQRIAYLMEQGIMHWELPDC